MLRTFITFQATYYNNDLTWLPKVIVPPACIWGEDRDENLYWRNLTKDTSEEDVNWLIHVLISYNRILSAIQERTGKTGEIDKNSKSDKNSKTDKTIESCNYTAEQVFTELIGRMRTNKLVAPGGVRFVSDQGVQFFPGCCCGLEGWSGIVSSIQNKFSPWLGHEPEYCFDFIEDKFWISTYHTNWFGKREEIRADFNLDELSKSFKNLESDFNDFVSGPLKNYMNKYFPEFTDAFCEEFQMCFG